LKAFVPSDTPNQMNYENPSKNQKKYHGYFRNLNKIKYKNVMELCPNQDPTTGQIHPKKCNIKNHYISDIPFFYFYVLSIFILLYFSVII
jgi:hypothetical protein